VRCPDPPGYLNALIDRFPALIVTDGEAANWRFWILAPKKEQATRRVPVLSVTGSDDRAAAARAAGADLALLASDLVRLPDLVLQHARTLDAATLDWLRHQCVEPLPPEARAGIAEFNAGAYYRQHDLFEALWMAEPGPVRELYRAILQVGVAYYHLTRGNRAGAIKMLRRTAQWFAVLPDVCRGVDVRLLREDARRVRAVLEADAAPLHDFDRALLRPVRFLPPGEPGGCG
jgi:predicted metal-dependent hydrolase